MDIKEQSNYYAVIPANVRYDKRLKPQCQMLYAEITALTVAKGYCWARNAYFAERFGVSEPTIGRWLNMLKQTNYIYIEVVRDGSGKVVGRKIYIAEAAAERRSDSEKSGEKDHLSKMISGQENAENCHLSKMTSGENIAKTTLQNCGVEPLIKNDQDNNTDKEVINNKNLGGVDNSYKQQLRAREGVSYAHLSDCVTVDKFEETLACRNWGKYPNGDAYEKVRDTLIELINRGEVKLDEITRDDICALIGSMFKGTKRRRITDIRAYILATIKNMREAHREELKREHEVVEQSESMASYLALMDGLVHAVNVPRRQSFTDTEQAQRIWADIKLRLQLQMGTLSFEIWIEPIIAVGYLHGELILKFPSPQARDEVTERYSKHMQEACKQVSKAKSA